MNRPARTVFLGSGRFGIETLRALAAQPLVELVGVVTAPPRPAGRRAELTPTPIDSAAGELALRSVIRPERLRTPEAIASVLSLQPELAVLADYGQIVPRPLLELPHGALNLHPSLLPRHRGASPIAAAILAGDEQTGVSLMQMDEGLDTGPLVAQRRLPLHGDEVASELEAQLAVLAAELLSASLPAWIRGELEAVPQPAEEATLTRPLRRQDGRLDPGGPAAALERQVRAYQPWPGSWLDTSLGRLVIWRAGVLPSDEAGPQAGDLVAAGGSRERLALVTVDGLLEILEAQPAGGRRMPAAELLRGRPALLGSRLANLSGHL